MNASPTRFKLLAAVHVFLECDGQVLLLRRYQTGYEDGNYSVIAGHLDGEETVIDAAIREAYEEAGIQIAPKDLQVVGVMHRKIRAETTDNEYVNFFVRVTRWTGAIVNCEPHKCDELAWFPRDALPDTVIPYIRHALGHAPGAMWFESFGWMDQ